MTATMLGWSRNATDPGVAECWDTSTIDRRTLDTRTACRRHHVRQCRDEQMPSQQQGAGHLVLTANGNDAAEHGRHRRPVSWGGTRSEPGKLIGKLFLAKHRVQFIRGGHRRSLRIALGTATYAPIPGSVRQDVWPFCGADGKEFLMDFGTAPMERR